MRGLERDFLQGHVAMEQGGNGFNLRVVLIRYEKEILCCEALEQVVWRSCGCFIHTGMCSRQIEWGIEESDLVGEIPAMAGTLKLR